MKRCLWPGTLALALALTAVPVAGQTIDRLAPAPATAAEEAVSTEANRDRLARLSDAEVRALLLERLDRAAAEAADRPSGLEALGTSLGRAAEGFAASLSGAVARIPNLAGGVAEGLERFWAPRGWSGTLHLVVVGLVALGLGLLAERLLRRLFGNLEERLASARPAGLGDRLRLLLQRLALEAGGTALFIATAWLVIAAAYPPAPISYLILWFFLFVPVLYVRLAAAVTRFLLAPSRPSLRLVALADDDARFLHRALIAFAALIGLRSYALSFLGGHGVDLAAIRLGFWLTLALYSWLFFVAWRCRSALAGMLIGDGDVTDLERRIAGSYPWVAMALIALVWALSEVFVGLGLWHLLDARLPLTLAILIFAPVLDTAIRGLVRHTAPRLIGVEEIPASMELAMRRGLVRIGRTIALGLVLLLLLDLWNVGLGAPESGSFAALLAGRLVEATITAATGYLILEVASFWITRRLAAETPPPSSLPAHDAGGEGGAAGGSRLSTVLPLIRRGLQVGIVVVTALAVLSALGVSTTPLLAGAGIVGLAIGFGAQKLVADIVSGLFFLIDDAFRIGEYVEIGDTRGTVERISVRSLQLRHHLGAVHTIPFGEIPRLTNYSRDWVIMKLRFTVPFDTDLRKVKKLFKEIGRELMENPDIAPDLLEPFKSQGVLEVDDVGIVVRGKFMAKPGRQWVLRKEIYERVQRAFDANGIQFARREVRVRIDQPGRPGSDHRLDDTALHQAAAAAATAGPAPLV